MRAQRQLLFRVTLLGVIAAGFAFVVGGNRPGRAEQPPPAAPTQPAAAAPAAPVDEPDRLAVEKALAEFAKAFSKGDGKTLAAMWTVKGEYTSDDGTTFRGHAALEKAYTEFFAKSEKNALDVEIASIRFPSKDTAVVEGFFKLHQGKKELAVSKCSFLYAREDGKWAIAIAREWPGDGLMLRDLEWLIGSWEAKREGTTVTTTYEWSKNKTFIRCQFSIARDGQIQTGLQIFGKMPSTGELHMWTFEEAGGIGDSDLTRDGKKWIHAARGSTADGKVMIATNIITPIDADSFLWQTVERSLDGESLPDLPPIKVARVKAKS